MYQWVYNPCYSKPRFPGFRGAPAFVWNSLVGPIGIVVYAIDPFLGKTKIWVVSLKN